ncbi:MAG: CoA transferase [Rhodospirillaceae bacterium]|jgi:crotonobetainyl-CoA:carnitine CoA-transferase CaiB-like acyl-CoA transferase|nr:CoA transferase [Rhodospirillaceae bacterium]MBT4590097.1 CoA transferase [Rhodospirillaceae bacterium]MBT4940010.1 CoA transferase [Rhodospirillaceae bacterium]MBT7266599.1 CoA transferase [Rhodospirillaceae bacterium]
MPASELIKNLWEYTKQPIDIIDNLSLTGEGPVLPSSFQIDKMAQSFIALTSLSAAEIWRQRTGQTQTVAVDIKHAAAEFRSERYQLINSGPAPALWDAIAGAYQCGDGRWVRIHTNFDHHRNGILNILKCANERGAVQAALNNWQAGEFETCISEAGFLAVMMRSPDEWLAHPQGQAIARQPLLTITKIDDAPSLSFKENPERPLSEVRVLDLTRIIAGPVGGRTLAAHGANVLRVTSPHLPSIAPLVIDNGRGKRSAHIDLKTEDGKAKLSSLIKEADVFIQGYRPQAISTLGFSPDQVAKEQPGIIYASLSAYGPKGPWADRRGFDSLMQTVSGLNAAEAEALGSSQPTPLPNQALDHATGYLLAFGVMAALLRRAQEGGSWHVQVSLAQTGQWLQNLGQIDHGFNVKDQTAADIGKFLETSPSGFGKLTSIRHAGILSQTPAYWTLPSQPLGHHLPLW